MASREALTPGVAVRVGARARRVVAPNAGPMTGPGTNTYLLGDAEITVLDPGPDDPAHLDAILAACSGPVRWIVATHTHADHSPLARRLAAQTGAQLIGLPPPGDGRQDTTFRPTHLPVDGERLVLGDVVLTALHTPGHASNCVCYLFDEERLMFTGDHVLQGVSPVILPPDGSMSAYMNSLQRLMKVDFESIAPGHGTVMTDGKAVVSALHAHRATRESKALRMLADFGPVSLADLTPAVYDDVPAAIHGWARLTLEAHLIKLEHDGRALQHDGMWRIAAA